MALPILTTFEIRKLMTKEDVVQSAQALADLGGTLSEREDKQRRKQRIQEKLLHGIVLPFRWCVGHVPSIQRSWRVNGQHSSEVFLELPEEDWQKVRFPVWISWEEYTCETQVDLAFLFEQFDPFWSSRNQEDNIGVHLAVYEDLMNGIERHEAVRITSGLTWYRTKIERKDAIDGSQFNVLHEKNGIHDFMLWCGSFLQERKTDEMFNRPVIGAMFHTVRHDATPETFRHRERLQTFWKTVALGKVASDEGSLEYKLADFLALALRSDTEWPMAIRKQFQGNKRRPSDRDVFATCLRAAHAACHNTRVGDIFLSAKKLSAKELAQQFFPLP